MIQVKVDELTLSATVDVTDTERWPEDALDIVKALGVDTGIIEHLGDPMPAPSALMGYTTGFDYGTHSFLCKASFNDTRPSMGVALRVSAQALDQWRFVSNKHVREMLKGALTMKDAQVRVTRIDLAVDFVDEGLSVDEISQAVNESTVGFFKEQRDGILREISKGRRTHGKEGEVQTLYLGTRRKNSRWLARLYDKAAEQTSRKGPHLAFALKQSDWKRLELELRHGFADQAGSFLAECLDDTIADNATARYLHLGCQCWHLDDEGKPDVEEPWSEALVRGELVPPFISDYRSLLDLENSYAYHATDSGLISLLNRVEGVWGPDAPGAVMGALLVEQHKAEVKDAVKRWLHANAKDYRDLYPTIDKMLKEGAVRADARRKNA